MADCGNQFIVQTKLIDIPLGGPRFTSIDKGVPSLVSWIDLWLQKVLRVLFHISLTWL